jgi:hypothetical protein
VLTVILIVLLAGGVGLVAVALAGGRGQGAPTTARVGSLRGPVPGSDRALRAATAVEGTHAEVARIPWWRRLLSAALLVILVLLLGVITAVVLGAGISAVSEILDTTIR